MQPAEIKIRYNTQAPGDGTKCWRVIVDGQERIYDHVTVDGVAMSTTTDEIPGVGTKHHITVYDAELRETKPGHALIVKQYVPIQTKHFLITGLPRSRTAWLAALFCDGDVICYHEPILQTITEGGKMDFQKLFAIISETKLPFVGISDSSMPIRGALDQYLTQYPDAPILIVMRDQVEAFESYKKFTGMDHDDAIGVLGYVNDGISVLMQKRERKKLIVRYEDLSHLSTIMAIWTFLVPGVPFNVTRAEIFQRLIIQQDTRKYIKK